MGEQALSNGIWPEKKVEKRLDRLAKHPCTLKEAGQAEPSGWTGPLEVASCSSFLMERDMITWIVANRGKAWPSTE